MAGLAVRFRRKDTMSAIEEDQIQLVAGDSNISDDDIPSSSSSLQEEVHHVPSRVKKIRTKLSTSFTPTRKLLSWWVTVIVLAFISFLLVLVPSVLERSKHQKCVDFENVRGYANYEEFPFLFEESTNGKFVLCRRGECVLEGILGTNHTPLQEVLVDVYRHSSNTTLNISRLNLNCLRMEWSGLSSRESPIEDCYSLDGAHWYGMYMTQNQTWPINGAEIPLTPFLPTDYLGTSNVFGPILHPLWLSSKGSGIHIDDGIQLYYRINATNFCFLAEPYELECVPKASDRIFLKYTVCNFEDITLAAKFFLNESGSILHPNSKPDPELFKRPIWSTWVEGKTLINDDFMRSFYHNISSHRFEISQLEIDDGYSMHYGDLAFNKNVSVSVLSELSANVPLTAWVHPFINHEADDFVYSLVNDHFLPGFFKDESNSVSLVKWWQGYGAVINFLRSNTSQWQAQRLNDFVENNHLTSLKFDAGEFTYLPNCVYIHGLNNDPAMFAKAYVEFVANQSYSSRAEVRIGYYTQDHSVLIRLLDRNSVWGTNNGLKSVLNAVLSLGLAGYSYLLPDRIGGNGVDTSDLNKSETPDMELFIRWLQLNTFLPFSQFSLGPWRYDNEDLMEHVRKMMALHIVLSEQYFIPLSDDVISGGIPIIRPLWWLNGSEPQDSPIWTIDDQFLIGDRVMVAPILENGARTKSVYFPKGTSWTPVKPETAKKQCASGVCSNGNTVTFDIGLWDVLYFDSL